MIKVSRFFLLVLILSSVILTGSFGCKIVYGNEYTGTSAGLIPIDVILVLDVSFSMRTADPSRISQDAMNLFIEKLEEGRDRVAVVAYAGRVEAVSVFKTINSQDDRQYFRQFTNGLTYASWTDHGPGLLEALHILQNHREDGRQQMIVMLTDGNLSLNPNGVRTVPEAEYDMEQALQWAQEMNVPISTIGLNFDGSLDWNYVYNISAITGGTAFETSSADYLIEIIEAIFDRMIANPKPIEDEAIYVYYAETIENALPKDIHEDVLSTEQIGTGNNEAQNEYESYSGMRSMPPGTVIIALLAVLVFLLWTIVRGGKRVFTGQLMVEIIDPTASEPIPPVSRNLIEYGSRTNLHKIIGQSIGQFRRSDAKIKNAASVQSVLEYIILSPCPVSPSHLPQLSVKCKNSKVRIVKDFLEQDASKGLTIGAGNDLFIQFVDERVQVYLKYIV